MTELDKARFWIKVKQTPFCWLWQGVLNNNGYGIFRMKKPLLAHRVSYSIINNSIPKGKQVLHSCDNPQCVNPSHLFTGTHQDNMKDKAKKGRARHQGRTSLFYGVGFRNDSRTWRAYVTIRGKIKFIGTYKTEVEAAKARDKYCFDNEILAVYNFEPPKL